MELTAEQRAIVDHDADTHLVVRAVPGSGKTTTLVHRVAALVGRGVDPRSIQVVMFNRAVRDTCVERLAAMGVPGVRVNTFDSLCKRLLHAAIDRGWSRASFEDDRAHWARLRAVHAEFADDIDDVEDLDLAIGVWRAHLVPPSRAAFSANPALVEAYRRYEEMRTTNGVGLGLGDYNYTAVGILQARGRLEPAPAHLLVDEFQDVNPARVRLLELLADDQTQLVAVGDEDQGINEWCGAHPRFFTDFQARFRAKPTVLRPLSTSFRLGPVTAAAANRLIVHNVGRTPAVVVGGGPARGEVLVGPDLPEAIRDLLRSGVAPGALAILYRSRLEGAAVLSALARARLPVNTDDRDLLRRGPGPDILRVFFRAAFDDHALAPREAWLLARAGATYVRGEPFRAGWLQHQRGGLRAYLADKDFHAAAGQSAHVVAALAKLPRVLDGIAGCRDTGAAVRRVEDLVDAEAVLRTPGRSERSANQAVAAYEAASDWLAAQALPPAEALAALDGLDLSGGRPASECVYANTVHKAKGLEWPVVIVAGVFDGGFPAESFGGAPGSVDAPAGFPQSPFMEQERRTFYVAITRARDTVVIHRPVGTTSRFFAELVGKAKAPSGAAGSATHAAPGQPPRTVRRPRGEAEAAAGARAWTTGELALLEREWAAGAGLAAIAELVGRTSTDVAARLVRLGLVESRGAARLRP